MPDYDLHLRSVVAVPSTPVNAGSRSVLKNPRIRKAIEAAEATEAILLDRNWRNLGRRTSFWRRIAGTGALLVPVYTLCARSFGMRSRL
jgi:hypothetical protein